MKGQCMVVKRHLNHSRVVWYQNNAYFFLIWSKYMLFMTLGHIWAYLMGYVQKWPVSVKNPEAITRDVEWAVTSHPLVSHQLSAKQWRVLKQIRIIHTLKEIQVQHIYEIHWMRIYLEPHSYFPINLSHDIKCTMLKFIAQLTSQDPPHTQNRLWTTDWCFLLPVFFPQRPINSLT